MQLVEKIISDLRKMNDSLVLVTKSLMSHNTGGGK